MSASHRAVVNSWDGRATCGHLIIDGAKVLQTVEPREISSGLTGFHPHAIRRESESRSRLGPTAHHLEGRAKPLLRAGKPH